jgi:hypothetical protein
MSLSGNRYWAFYWPLCITSMAIIFGEQFQNAALSHFSESTKDISIYAVTISIFALFNSTLIFTPQLVGVMVKDIHSRQLCGQFILLFSIVLLFAYLAFSFSTFGAQVISFSFNFSDETTAKILFYTVLLSPLIVVNAMRQYLMGLLIKHRATLLVTFINGFSLCILVVSVFIGYLCNIAAIENLILAQFIGSLLSLAVAAIVTKKYVRFPSDKQAPTKITFYDIYSFFWPVAITSTIFGLTRPLIFAFLGQTHASIESIAVLKLSFDFMLIFVFMLNQVRHLFTSFGHKHIQNIKHFLVYLMLFVSSIMIIITATPIFYLVFGGLINADETIQTPIRDVLWIMCLMPAVIAFRNYYHGLMLLGKTTQWMVLGASVRVATISFSAWLCLVNGILDHIAAAWILWLGYASEALMVYLAIRFGRISHEKIAVY